MTQEEKDLLLKDLCARLPYGVKIELTWWVMGEGTYINTTLEPDHIEQLLNDEDSDIEIKPYLFHLSSMTDEQEKEYNETLGIVIYTDGTIFKEDKTYYTLDWLNKNHFDYRGLIERGLAIDATGLNIY